MRVVDPTTRRGGCVLSIAVAVLTPIVLALGFHGDTNFPAEVATAAKFVGVALGLYWIWLVKQKTGESQPSAQAKIPPPASIRCFRCKADIAVTPELRGKKTKCPSCGTKQELPG